MRFKILITSSDFTFACANIDNFSFSPNNTVYTTVTAATGTWYHLAMVHDLGNKTITFYVNNSAFGPSQYSTVLPIERTDYTGFAINGTVTTPGGLEHAAGSLIDAVGIWNRPLYSNEISTLYNSGSGLQYPFT